MVIVTVSEMFTVSERASPMALKVTVPDVADAAPSSIKNVDVPGDASESIVMIIQKVSVSTTTSQVVPPDEDDVAAVPVVVAVQSARFVVPSSHPANP